MSNTSTAARSALDLRILARTIWQVLLRRDINQPGHATAEEFTGNGDAMKVMIVGAGGHGQVVADMIAARRARR